MTEPSRQSAIPHAAQFAAERLLGHGHLVLVEKPLHQVDHAPAGYTVDGGDRAVLERLRQSRPIPVVQDRLWVGAFVVDQGIGAVRVQLQYPIPRDLDRNAADGGRFGSGRAIGDRGQPANAGAGRRPGYRATRRRRAASSLERSGVGMAHLIGSAPPDQIVIASGRPCGSQAKRFGISGGRRARTPRHRPRRRVARR